MSNNPQNLSPIATARLCAPLQPLYYTQKLRELSLHFLVFQNGTVPYFKYLGTASRNNILSSYGRVYESFGLTGYNVPEFYRVTKFSEKHITSIFFTLNMEAVLSYELLVTTFQSNVCNHLPV